MAVAARNEQGRGARRRAPGSVRLHVRAATLVVALGAVLLAPSAAVGLEAAPGDPDLVTWGVRPADTEQGADRPNYAYSLDPGATLEDAIVVSNYTTEPLTFRIYAADGFITDDGVLDLLAAGEDSTALGSWVSFDDEEVTVEGAGSVTVPFELTVPADATPGDYAAGIVSSLLVENTEGVSVDRRLGSRMHLRISGDLLPRLEVTDVQVGYAGSVNPFAPGDAAVTFTVTNTGNTRLAAGESVQVNGLWGLGGAAAPRVELPELLPGTSREQVVAVEDVWPAVRVDARVVLDAAVVTAGAGGDEAGDDVAPVEVSASTWAVPWTALVALVVIVAAIVWWRVQARRRKAGDDRRIAAAVAQALAEREAELLATQSLPLESEPPAGAKGSDSRRRL